MGSAKKIEYGDFQTPRELALSVTKFLRDAGVSPSVVVEPTCGQGSFVQAAIETFKYAKELVAFDINEKYIAQLRRSLQARNNLSLHVLQQNFFDFDWKRFFAKREENILVLGNPPWVTNAALGSLGSENLPVKNNFQNHAGFAAKTGKANFDISEWMLIKLLETLNNRSGCLAMLCKTATARKVLKHSWLRRFNVSRASIHLIDASLHFGVSVDACLFVVHTGLPDSSSSAGIYSDLSFDHKVTIFGLVGKELVADIDEYSRLRDLDGLPYYTWRSGVKHDASSVMELTKKGAYFVNGSGEEVNLESRYLYPLLKSSDLANGRLVPQKYVLLTQRRPSEDTKTIADMAPKTWSYLLKHAAVLDARRSVIYEKRPRFSVFGVGDYTFAPWKVAISGLYKNCLFQVVGTYHDKPIVFDDTCYFVPCASKREAEFICSMLNSDISKRFLRSLIFIDAKRPITIDILNRIDLKRLAERLGFESTARHYFREAGFFEGNQALLVYEKSAPYRTKAATRRAKSTH